MVYRFLGILTERLNSVSRNPHIELTSILPNDFPNSDATFLAVEQVQKQLVKLNHRNKHLENFFKDFQEKKRVFSHVIENLPVGFAVSNLVDKKVLFTNKELADVYGFKPKFLDEIYPYHISPQDDELARDHQYPEGISPADILMSHEKKGQIVLNKKGQYQTVDIKRIPFKKQGLMVTLISNVSDLTEKEEELAASERISRLIFNTAEVGLSLLDEDGKFINVNKTFCSIYGYQEGELVGRHFSILVPLHKRAELKKNYKQRIQSNSPISTSLEEAQVLKKTGEVLDLLITSRIVKDHHFRGTIYSVLDVTEVKTNHNRLQAAVEGGKLGTWNVNLETGINSVNSYWAEMLGYKESEVESTLNFFISLLHPDDEADFMREVEKIKEGKQNSLTMEVRLKCKGGGYKWILDSGKVIKWTLEGKPLLMAGCHIDIDTIKKAELETIKNSDRLRRAQEMGMVGDWELDIEKQSFSCSGMIYRMFGRKRDRNLSFKEFLALFGPTTAKQIEEYIHLTIEEHKSFSHEAKVYQENGTLKYLKLIAVPILGINRNVIKVSGIIQDITSIKVTLESLANTAGRLRVLSDNIPGGLIQFKVSTFYPPQILYLSRGAEKVWGLTREQALSGDVNKLFQNIHPKDHNIIKRTLLIASNRLKRLNVTWRTISEVGETRWHHCTGIPVLNKDNTVTWNTLVLDITDRKNAEFRIKEQDQYMQVLTQHASDGIIACDQLGKVRFLNETLRSWIGTVDPSIKPEKWSAFYHLYSIEDDKYLKKSELSLFQVLETGEITNKEFLIKRPGFPIRYVQASGSPLSDSSGNSLGAMVVLRDITEQVQKELEVSNAIIKAREKERAKIASEIHDGITQSLSVVAMNMKNLRIDYAELNSSESYGKALGYLQDVIEQSRKLAHKIMPNSIQDFGLIEAIQELVDQYSMGSKKDISLKITGEERIAPNKELHIFRIIQEGLGNSIKHSEATHIQIRLYFAKSHLRACIQDNGKGFEVQKSYLKNGIGLLSMRDRVKKLKGKFRVFSGEKGTIVWFKIPVKSYLRKNE